MEALLTTAKLEAGTLSRSASELDVVDAVRQAMERLRPRARIEGARVEARLPGRPVRVRADRDHLARILDNLLNNALTYTRRTPEVAIRVTRDGTRALVRVEDNGIGIPRNQRERVFERFFRSPDPMMAKVPGIGLGLYISRGLVESHGGKLVVEKSDARSGTVFAISLPLAA